MKYIELVTLFKKCRNKNRGYRLGGRNGSTRIVEASIGFKNNDMAIELHGTNVVTVSVHEGKETYKLNNGGWYSKVSADRIRAYSPVSVFSVCNTWYVSNRRGRVFEYRNGMEFDLKGNCKTKNIKSWTRTEFYGVTKRIEIKYFDKLSNAQCTKSRYKTIKRGEYQRLQSEKRKEKRGFEIKRANALPANCGLYNPPAPKLHFVKVAAVGAK